MNKILTNIEERSPEWKFNLFSKNLLIEFYLVINNNIIKQFFDLLKDSMWSAMSSVASL